MKLSPIGNMPGPGHLLFYVVSSHLSIWPPHHCLYLLSPSWQYSNAARVFCCFLPSFFSFLIHKAPSFDLLLLEFLPLRHCHPHRQVPWLTQLLRQHVLICNPPTHSGYKQKIGTEWPLILLAYFDPLSMAVRWFSGVHSIYCGVRPTDERKWTSKVKYTGIWNVGILCQGRDFSFLKRLEILLKWVPDDLYGYGIPTYVSSR